MGRVVIILSLFLLQLIECSAQGSCEYNCDGWPRKNCRQTGQFGGWSGCIAKYDSRGLQYRNYPTCAPLPMGCTTECYKYCGNAGNTDTGNTHSPSGCSCNDGGACLDNTPFQGKLWCYVEEGACSDNAPFEGKYWSFEACKTSNPQPPVSDREQQPNVPVGDTSGFTQFAKEGLEAHNKRRTVPLELDAALCEDAQAYADHLAYYDIFEHDQQQDQGENLAYSWGKNEQAEDVVKSWYDEKFTGEQCMGHYTQVVWKESKKFCMAKSESASKKIYSVARYYPAGNFGYQDDYERNVERGFVCPCCG